MTTDKEAFIVPSKGKRRVHTENVTYIFHIPSVLAEGKISIYEGIFKNPGKHKNLHYHKYLTETFTVLHGEFIFYLKNKELVLGKDDSILVPPGVHHGFSAKLAGSRLQIGFTGSGPDRDEFFIGLAKIVNGEVTMDPVEKERFFNQHDQYTVFE